MDFSGWVPPELLFAAAIIAVLFLAVAGFSIHDWLLPFVHNHVSVH